MLQALKPQAPIPEIDHVSHSDIRRGSSPGAATSIADGTTDAVSLPGERRYTTVTNIKVPASTTGFTITIRATSDGQIFNTSISASTACEQTIPIAKTHLAAKMFANKRLFDKICVNLPHKDLLLAQRVCKTFKSLIERSHQLQQALFLLPAKCGSIAWMCAETDPMADCLDDIKTFEELQRVKIMSATTSQRQARIYWHDGEHHTKGVSALLPYPAHWGLTATDVDHFRIFENTLLHDKLAASGLFPDCFSIRSQDRALDTKGLSALRAAISYQHASWKRMIITQPPIRRLVFYHASKPLAMVYTAPDPFAGFRAMPLLTEPINKCWLESGVGGFGYLEPWTDGTDLERVVKSGCGSEINGNGKEDDDMF